MNEITKVNPQVIDAIQAAQQATLTGEVIRHSGAGKAYQSVAQSAAITVQDATDMLRNFNTIGTTAAGVAAAQLIETGDSAKFGEVIASLNTMLTNSISNYGTINQKAAGALSDFPSGK